MEKEDTNQQRNYSEDNIDGNIWTNPLLDKDDPETKFRNLAPLSMRALLDKDELFLDSKENIVCIWGKFNRENYKERFSKWGYLVEDPEFIDAIYEVIMNRDESSNPDYWNFKKYKVRFSIGEKILFEDLAHFYQEFLLIGGNLYSKRANSFLNEESRKRFFSIYRLPLPSYNEVRSIYKLIKTLVTEKYKVSNNLIIQDEGLFLGHHNIMQWIVSEQRKVDAFSFDETGTMERLIKHKLRHVPAILKQNAYRRDEIPENFANMLWLLTGGKRQLIDRLAILISRMNRKKIIEPRMAFFVNNIPDVVFVFLFNLYSVFRYNVFRYKCFEGNSWEYRKGLSAFSNRVNLLPFPTVYTEKELINPYNIPALIDYDYLGVNLNISVFKGDLQETDFSKLRRLICGRKIRFEDRVSQMDYRSRTTYLHISDSIDQLQQYLKCLPKNLEVFKLKDLTADQCKEFETPFSDKEALWIHTVFAAYGLKLMTGKKIKKSGLVYSKDELVKSFIKNCCKKGETYSCYTSDIYEPFQELHSKLFSDEIPLMSQREFSKIIRSIGIFEYCQPHKRNGCNARGYRGLDLDEDKYQEYIKSQATDVNQEETYESYEDVRKYLLSMNKELSAFLINPEH